MAPKAEFQPLAREERRQNMQEWKLHWNQDETESEMHSVDMVFGSQRGISHEPVTAIVGVL